jgi:hypothetical protein
MLGSEGIYIGSEEGKGWGMGQSDHCTEVILKSVVVFWVMTPPSQVFPEDGGDMSFRNVGIITTFKTTRHHNPEEHNPHLQGCRKISHFILKFYLLEFSRFVSLINGSWKSL